MYDFVCLGCNASFVGDTQRYFKTRIDEHSYIDKKSRIFHQLVGNDSSKSKYSESCKVNHTASYVFRLKVKEMLHIKQKKPVLIGKIRQESLLTYF